LNYLPGLFGPSQIIFRNENELYIVDEDPDSYYRRVLFPQKAERDLAYFRRSSCLEDILFIIKGVLSTLLGLVNLKRFLRLQGKILILDTLLIVVAWAMANIFRFGGVPPQEHFEIMIKGFFIVPPLLLAGMLAGGCYRCPVKYFSLHSALILTFVITMSCLPPFLILIKLYGSISLYLTPMAVVIVLALLASPRVFARIRWEKSLTERSDGTERMLIYGAGRTGLALASCFANGKLIGFVDDDPDLRGTRIRGFKVFGHESDIPTMHKVYPFENLWVTFEPATDKRMRLEKFCECNNIKLLILPELEPFTSLQTYKC